MNYRMNKINMKEMSDDFLVWVIGRQCKESELVDLWYKDNPTKSPYLKDDKKFSTWFMQKLQRLAR